VVILFQTFSAVIRNTFEPTGETGRSDAPVLRIHRVEEPQPVEAANSESKEASSIG
jgi:hypothetical protein